MPTLTSLFFLAFSCSTLSCAADISIFPVTHDKKDGSPGYFSDPFHVDYRNATELYIAGTTHQYLKCKSGDLSSGCASVHENKYESSSKLNHTVKEAHVKICGAAGIHPFQSEDRSWDALVTLHVQEKNKPCKGISGWSVIVHAHSKPQGPSHKPPHSWEGDRVMIGSFSKNVDANYDGKYFQTPDGKLYLVYQKQKSTSSKRDGVFAWPMNNVTTLTPGTEPRALLLPGDHLNSEDYVAGNHSFKLIETGNIQPINGKFVMAYSVGAYNHKTYKIGIAYSDTFLPKHGQQYRKVMKDNPHGLWNSKTKREVYYLLQSQETHDGWHYVGDQVVAPGVPTVAKIGPDDTWTVLFAGYDPDDHPSKDGENKFEASHRRPYFAKIDVNVPKDVSVKEATHEQLQGWITPSHGG